jgi:hypothetical protein
VACFEDQYVELGKGGGCGEQAAHDASLVSSLLCILQFIALLAGLLPFGSIFIETYFVFTSFWNYKVGFGGTKVLKSCDVVLDIIVTLLSFVFLSSSTMCMASCLPFT